MREMSFVRAVVEGGEEGMGNSLVSPRFICTLLGGVSIFKLPYHFRGMDVLLVHPFVI